jgi:serine/threonine protein kinase/Tfp pilus assembly protein PilF
MPVSVRTLDDYVDAFERVRLAQEEVELASFLPGSDDPLYHDVLRELVRIDMEFGWESNRPTNLDNYRARFPELFDDPDSLQAVAFEEYRLRRRAGQTPNPQDYARRYGVRTDGWPHSDPEGAEASVQLDTPVRAFQAFQLPLPVQPSVRLEGESTPAPGEDGFARLFHDLLCADRQTGGRLGEALAALPEPGTTCLGFELVAELGAGAFGKVYLARQPALADRPVALKVSPDVGTESQALARLQHTHIVPIYSVHHGGVLQAVCMPYCGTVTVADVVRDLHGGPMLPTGGLELLAPLARKPRPAGVPLPEPPSQAVQASLAGSTYADAVLWLCSCLASGLAHAHERGVLHRDIKPANILLADEGLPMLLDFNVAESAKPSGGCGDTAAALVGGTLPYMAPEQLTAFRDRGGTVDGRSDIYSLGIVLFELLTGRFPFPAIRLAADQDTDSAMDEVLTQALAVRRAGPPCPRRINPAVSPAAASIVRHCLEPDPARRYPSASALREDIDRHLANLPLRYAPEPSLVERVRKWKRRNPRLPVQLGLVAAALMLLAAIAGGWMARRQHQATQAEKEMQAFHKDYGRALFLLGTQPDTARQREEGEQVCRAALDRYGLFTDPTWQKQWRLTALPAPRQQKLKEQFAELLLVLARTTANEKGQLQLALDYLRQAETCFDEDVPAALWEQRARLYEKARQPEEARLAHEQARAITTKTPLDCYLQAWEYAHNRQFKQARELLEPALAKVRDHYWAWFLLGICQEGQGNDGAAETCYTICIGLDEEFHAAYHNRGVIRLRHKQYAQALSDFDQVVALAPDRAEAYWDRCLARRGAGDLKGALADLDEARDRGIPLTRIYFARGQVLRQSGDESGARAEEARGLKRRPSDELSWVARGFFRLGTSPQAALADFDEALKLNPRSRLALENKAHVLAEKLDRQKEANEVLEQVLELYPESVKALAGQAVVLARLGQRDRAHKRIARALKIDPIPEVLYQTACVHALTSRQVPDDTRTALTFLREALIKGYGLTLVETDPDLAQLRGKDGYRPLVRLARQLQPPAPAGK